jgi:hypothetical protein
MCVGDLSNAVVSAQIHAGLSKSMCRGRGPGACAGESKVHFRPVLGTSSGEYALNVNVN